MKPDHRRGVKAQYFPLKERGVGAELGGGDCLRERSMRAEGVAGPAAVCLGAGVRVGNSALKKVRFSGGWSSPFPQPLLLQEVCVAR